MQTETDLFPNYCDAVGFMVRSSEEIIGYFSYTLDDWNKRLRLTDILLQDDARGKGYGTQIMDFIKQKAKIHHMRAIVLETQTCNTKAIAFYQKNGFTFLGIDLYCYSNQDIENKEVRLEMIYRIGESYAVL